MAAVIMPNLPLIAVDTNVLIDLAEGNEIVVDCFSTIRRKFPSAPIIIPPTVIVELADIASDWDTKSEKESALVALQNIRSEWGFHPMNCVPVSGGIDSRRRNPRFFYCCRIRLGKRNSAFKQ
jgi:hypothetical protein